MDNDFPLIGRPLVMPRTSGRDDTPPPPRGIDLPIPCPARLELPPLSPPDICAAALAGFQRSSHQASTSPSRRQSDPLVILHFVPSRRTMTIRPPCCGSYAQGLSREFPSTTPRQSSAMRLPVQALSVVEDEPLAEPVAANTASGPWNGAARCRQRSGGPRPAFELSDAIGLERSGACPGMVECCGLQRVSGDDREEVRMGDGGGVSAQSMSRVVLRYLECY